MSSHSHLTHGELQALLQDEDQLAPFLVRYGLIAPAPATCPTSGCGAPVGGTLSWRRGVPYWRCGRHRHRITASTPESPLASAHLGVPEVVTLLYYWSAQAGVVQTAQHLGLSRRTVGDWFARCRQCVACSLDPDAVLGGDREEVEADETEIGRRRKGVHGHDSRKRVDVRGVFHRRSKRVFLEPYDKLDARGYRRFGPPNLAEARALFQHVAPGSILFTDRARAYDRAARERRLVHRSVNHQGGEFVRRQVVLGRRRYVGTQGMDGTWGLLKQFLRRRGNPPTHQVSEYVDEFAWRRNLRGADPFWALLDAVARGHWL